jgi:mRNA-degrading endonuclease RelE of RelBE toxin-antitoxin system
MPAEPYEIRYAAEAVADLRAMRAFDQRNVLDGIELHLRYQPQFVSRSRIKAMTQPFWSQYRLRIDDFPIYYDLAESDKVVSVLRDLVSTEPAYDRSLKRIGTT